MWEAYTLHMLAVNVSEVAQVPGGVAKNAPIWRKFLDYSCMERSSGVFSTFWLWAFLWALEIVRA
jgi:hypothetical protein